MSLWKIAWRSIQQRSLASLLTAISMALGVMLVVAVLVIYSVVHHAFHRGGEGYDLIVGPPKGSNLELVLSSVFYVGQPISTLPYSVYRDLYESRIGLGWCEIGGAHLPGRHLPGQARRRHHAGHVQRADVFWRSSITSSPRARTSARTTSSTPWPGPPRPSNSG